MNKRPKLIGKTVNIKNGKKLAEGKEEESYIDLTPDSGVIKIIFHIIKQELLFQLQYSN